MKIQKQDILRIERLARLKLPEEQLESFSGRLSKVFDWIDQLREVPIEGVTPLASPVMNMPLSPTGWREDVITDGECQDKILSNAPEAYHGSFVVPKVVE